MATTRSPSVSTTLLQHEHEHDPRHDLRVLRRADPSAGLGVSTEQPSVLGEAAKTPTAERDKANEACRWFRAVETMSGERACDACTRRRAARHLHSVQTRVAMGLGRG